MPHQQQVQDHGQLDSVLLQRFDHRTSAEALENQRISDNQHSIPIDGGVAAWKMLLSAFLFEALFWGFPLSFGVFQNYYSHLPEYAHQPYIAVIGTVASGISYMGAPLIIPLLKRLQHFRKSMIWTGWFMCILGILASSFTHSFGALVFTQGVMYGVGFTVFYYPIIGMVNEYWVARRGMAYGILCSSSGVSGVAMPFTLDAMLNRYGHVTTLRAVAIGLTVLTGPLIFFIKGRTTQPQEASGTRTGWNFLHVPLFWVYAAANTMQGLGYFFPSLFLPSYATSQGMSARTGALILAIMSISQVFGQQIFGHLSDRRASLNTLALVSTSISAVAIYTLWGFARNLAVLCIFAITYGFFGAGYTALWGRMGTAVSSDTTAAFTAFGLFNFSKGVGNVLAGPISGLLLVNPIDRKRYAAAKFEAVVLFSGSCMLASAVITTAAYHKHWKMSSQ